MHIQFKKVGKCYQGQSILKDIHWQINDGERWKLSGPSGIGKTTLLRLLLGLEKPDCGELHGLQNVFITVCFQEARLCEWMNAVHNIQLVCEKSAVEIQQELAMLLPMQCLDQPTGTLSGGMQRRVAVVRALMPKSELVILDEPFAGVDAAQIETMIAYIEKRLAGRACVMVSHEEYILKNMKIKELS